MKMIKGTMLIAALAMPLMGYAADPATNVTWKSSIAAGATYKDGNTDKTLYTTDFKADRTAPRSDWINSVHGEYGKTESQQTEGQLRGQSDYRYKFDGGNFFGGVFTEGYHDAIKDIYVRVKLGPELGYYFINSATVKLDGIAGLNEVYESTSDGDKDYAEWRVASHWDWTIAENSSAYASVEYSAPIDDHESGTGLLVTGLKSKIQERFAMYAELRNDYENKPAGGREHSDTTVVVGVAYDIM